MFKKMTVKDFCLISIFTALIAVMAQISIPMPLGVDMTMQTFAISLAAVILGANRSAVCAVIYLLIGAFGMPVFSQFSGGIGVIFGRTGGFLLSFPLMAWVIGFGAEKNNNFSLIAGFLGGTIINFLTGMLVFSLVSESSWAIAFAACVVPFIPTTIIKSISSAIIGLRIKRVLKKSNF